MGLADRLLVLLFTLGAIVLASMGVLISIPWIIEPSALSALLLTFAHGVGTRWAVGGVSLVILLISLRFLFTHFIRPRKVEPGVERETEIGQVHISLSTLESVAMKAAGRVRGISELVARVKLTGDRSVSFGLKVAVDGEFAIQTLSEQLQLIVKEQVEQLCGVKVDQVSVYVTRTVQPARVRVR